ncbi:hypothetical protein MRX96_023833 [Rhipicephalus microplus]
MHRGANRACAIILPLPKSDCRSPCLGFTGGTHIDTLEWRLQPSLDSASTGTLSNPPTIKEQRPSRPHCGLGDGSTTLSSNTRVFAVQMINATLYFVLLPLVQTMITAALCHVLLPLVRTVCTVAPMEHAPSFHHYSIQIAVPLVFASPEERISTPYYWMLQ